MRTPKYKRILAMLGILLIFIMYILTFVSSLSKSSSAQAMFRASLACTIIVPVFLYLITMVARLAAPKKSEVVDGVIISRDRVLTDGSGNAAPYADSLILALRRSGINTIVYESKDGDLRHFLLDCTSRRELKKERYIYIDTSEENVLLSKKAGFGGMVFTDIRSCQKDLRSVGVRL